MKFTTLADTKLLTKWVGGWCAVCGAEGVWVWGDGSKDWKWVSGRVFAGWGGGGVMVISGGSGGGGWGWGWGGGGGGDRITGEE